MVPKHEYILCDTPCSSSLLAAIRVRRTSKVRAILRLSLDPASKKVSIKDRSGTQSHDYMSLTCIMRFGTRPRIIVTSHLAFQVWIRHAR